MGTIHLKRLQVVLHRLDKLRSTSHHYLYKMLWLGSISVCLPLLLAGFVYYHFIVEKTLDDVQKLSASSLQLAGDRMERIFQSTELSSIQLSADPLISGSFLDGNAADKPLIHEDVLKLIQLAQNSNDFVDNIILYNHASEDILDVKRGFVLKSMDNQLSMILDRLMQTVPTDRCMYISDIGGFLGCVRYLTPANSNKAKGLLIITLKNELIQKYLEGPALYSAHQSILVLDSANRILTHIGSHFQWEQAILNERGIQSIISSEENTGELIATDAAGRRFYYSFLKTELGRTYISKIAEADILQNINRIRYFIAFSIFLLLCLGMLLSIVTGIKTYNPIRELINFAIAMSGKPDPKLPVKNEISFIRDCWTVWNEESRKNDAFVKKWGTTVRESVLLQLLEQSALPQEEIANFDRELALSLSERPSFVVLAIKLENLYRENRFRKNDGPIVAFIIKNIFSEILAGQEQLTGDVMVDRNGYGIGILSFHRAVHEEDRKPLMQAFASELTEAFHHYLRMQVCIGIGKVYSGVQDLSISYRQALDSMMIRIYQEKVNVMFFQEIEITKKTAFHYPMALEEILLQQLQNGKYSEAGTTLLEYIEAVKSSESYRTISNCYHLLLASMIKSLHQLGYTEVMDAEDADFLAIHERKTSLEIYDWFIQQIFPLFERVAGKNKIIIEVCRYINDHIQDDISLAHCAEYIGISAPHLSKLFKREIGMNFLDYVLDRKLKNAQELLVNTDMSLQKIAERIGYSERSLIRNFQKYIHMTPNQYRLSKLQ